jgi:hypothetical protein
MGWPLVLRRLEGFQNINYTQIFEKLRAPFAGRFTPRQYKTLAKRVRVCGRDSVPGV